MGKRLKDFWCGMAHCFEIGNQELPVQIGNKGLNEDSRDDLGFLLRQVIPKSIKVGVGKGFQAT